MKAKIIFFILVVFLVGGCAGNGKYVPKYAITDPAKGISIIHPVEIEKAGIKTITIFQGLMDPGLWVEVVNAGGVWTFLALTDSGKILDGYAYLLGINYWGDWRLQFVLLKGLKKEDKETAKFIYFNRDAGYCYNLIGDQVEYDPKKFDEDKEYRLKLFQDHGKTLVQIDSFFLDYLREKRLNPPDDLSSLIQIEIGSLKWKNFKSKIAKRMQYNYKMGNGEIRCGWLPLKHFSKEAVEIPGFNGTEQYLKRANVPLLLFPFVGVGLMVIAGANIIGDIAAAGIDDSWSGSYARSTVVRYKMAPLFRQICLIYKELLKKRDERINRLEFKLELQKLDSQYGKEKGE